MNDKPCGECQHFDVIIRGKRETKHGWCAKKSKYPAKEGPGQVFPEGVERVGNGELAQPVIVGVAEDVAVSEEVAVGDGVTVKVAVMVAVGVAVAVGVGVNVGVAVKVGESRIPTITSASFEHTEGAGSSESAHPLL